ncbi:MAG: acyl-CoA/acyl-ACP dehydrogenase [Xanthobacteraceae bacterium]|nr:acyl-CoA/acyl-ACP dehydrogenase [Xanthobacteraceae bacterium]QYK46185.1 MAG: acyl-CoA/acyl-ACP dehydrogenase [Xanthobacteraceae bacterium]
MTGRDSMIADSAKTFLARIGGTARARKLRDSGTPFDAAAWKGMAELGWFGLLVPEESGGLGLGGFELIELMEALGAQLAGEPVAEAIAAAVALAPRNSVALCGDVIAGTAVVVPVAGEGFKLAGGRITGTSKPVVDLAAGSHALVAAAGDDSNLYAVSLLSAGALLETRATVDGRTVSVLRLDMPSEAASRIPVRNARGALAHAQAITRLSSAAYLVGLADAAFAMALEYMKTRKQFGVPIGSFQALQHRAATVYVRIASVRALVSECARAYGTERFVSAASAAASTASEMALQVTKESIQFHGAIGFADEHDIGLYFRRAMSVIASIGTAAECLDDYSRGAASVSEKISSAA